MATAAPRLPPIPPPDVPPIDPRTNQWDSQWYVWLKAVDEILRTVRSEIP